ncbi:MAG TPA: DUF6580 family putative transport protein [Terriglobales bacterium]|nr:DUF6580 family putative transport protein [Terriglobales bacterium]
MLAYIFVLFAIAIRFLPHPFAFTPVAAALLFFGARGSRRQLWIPVALFAMTDVVLTKFVYSYVFSWDHYVTIGWYALIIWGGTKLREQQRPLPVLGAALASSVSFFLISNFAAWAAWADLYPRTLNGVMASYVAGLPYFRRGLEGDLLFTAAMFATPLALHYLSGAVSKVGDHVASA